MVNPELLAYIRVFVCGCGTLLVGALVYGYGLMRRRPAFKGGGWDIVMMGWGATVTGVAGMLDWLLRQPM